MAVHGVSEDPNFYRSITSLRNLNNLYTSTVKTQKMELFLHLLIQSMFGVKEGESPERVTDPTREEGGLEEQKKGDMTQ